MQRRRVIACCLLSPSLPAACLPEATDGSALPADAPLMRISTLPDAEVYRRYAHAVLREAYARLGYRVEVQPMPGERALLSASQGVTDAELYRREETAALYPALVRVPVPLFNVEVAAFGLRAGVVTTGWQALKPFRLAYTRGLKSIEEGTRGLDVLAVPSMRQAFEMLQAGRVDVVLANRAPAVKLLGELGLSGVRTYRPLLASFPVYHYLNRQHLNLLEPLTAALRGMEASGRIEALRREWLRPYDDADMRLPPAAASGP